MKAFKDFDLEAKARIWPCLSHLSHICPTADLLRGVCVNFRNVGNLKLGKTQTAMYCELRHVKGT